MTTTSSVSATTKFTIEVSANIDLNGLTEKELKGHLNIAVFRAIGNGMLTGDTVAEVDEYSVRASANLDSLEDEIANWLQGQIEDGHLDAEGMARRIARYGLMMPSEFADEIKERAEQAQ